MEVRELGTAELVVEVPDTKIVAILPCAKKLLELRMLKVPAVLQVTTKS